MLQKKITFVSPSIRIINLSLNELKIIAKSRNIKDYKNISENDLIKILSETKPIINLSEKIKGIKKDVSELWHGFSKLKINESRRGLYNIKNQKKIFRTRNQRDRQKSSRIRKKSF